MSAPSRCHDCGHKPRRIISATRQTEGKPQNEGVPPRVRKKPCDCACHRKPVQP